MTDIAYLEDRDSDEATNLSMQATAEAGLTATGATPTNTVTYNYTDDDWGDLLTSYVKDGTTYTITSDELGNPLSDGERTYTWKHGRQLDTLTYKGVTWTYQYNADGLRTARTSDTKDYFYVYNGDKLTQVTIVTKGNNSSTTVIDLSYDASGTPLTMTINGTTYYYLTNVQGDVMGVIDESGVRHVSYFYDGYGRSYYLANTDDGEMISAVDPLGYRGYLLDSGTGLYYLQSRSYDPKVGRFINADAFVSTGQGVLGQNMFAYCLNNPISNSDYYGEFAVSAILGAVVGGAIGGALIGAVSHVVNCAINGQEVTGSGLLNATLTGAASGVIGAAIGTIECATTTATLLVKGLTSVGVGIGMGIKVGIESDGSKEQRISAGISAGLITAGSTFAGSLIPAYDSDAGFVTNAFANYVTTLVVGTPAEIVNVASQHGIQAIGNGAQGKSQTSTVSSRYTMMTPYLYTYLPSPTVSSRYTMMTPY